MRETLPVVRGTASDVCLVAGLIAAALHPVPLGMWLVPDEHRRELVLAAWARIWVEHALLGGGIRLFRDRTAVAVWLAPGRVTVGPWDYPRRLAAACGPYLPQFQALDRILDSRHPIEAHRHLAFVATRPDRQGAGRANALLSRVETPHSNVPTCAWATTATGRRILTNHGFVERDPIALPDDAGQVIPMWHAAEMIGTSR